MFQAYDKHKIIVSDTFFMQLVRVSNKLNNFNLISNAKITIKD